ncbi:indole-3-acetic acid-induced protein ARG7-like [Impatiens glandulifera]|uniref:indole-3-acetic acid-induced protein ARG7-like n=1 Tax=Impatiens glandulifera TaxID=253017 RepID=UPI001FB0EA90|nr:indole-3-acetic acid-induced protein ARG7-like [Impatiens glandulifera]
MSVSIKIRHIVRLRQMLLRWRRKAAASSARSRLPSDVPSGHVALRVGCTDRRFVIPATYLNHPIFRKLLIQAEEEYGFKNSGPLSIPCDELLFEEILRQVAGQSESVKSVRCNVGMRSKVDLWPESCPLLDNGVNYKSY